MPLDQELFDDLAVDQMLLDNPLEDWWVTLTVPGAFGIDHRDGAPQTNAKAIRLGPKDATGLGEFQLIQAFLQVVPRRQRSCFVTAFWLRLIAAQEDVALYLVDAQLLCDTLLQGDCVWLVIHDSVLRMQELL